MEYFVGAVAFAIILFVVLRRRDPRVATIKSLPRYGTDEAGALQDAIAQHGTAKLLSASDGVSPLVEIEPARSEEYFRERIGNGAGRPATSPVARMRRARLKPVKPKPPTAPRVRPGFAPSKTLLVYASNCRICGRPLTNSESQRRGVGSDCYRNYGARVVHAPNPAYSQWSHRKNVMEAQQLAWQKLLDELYAALMKRFEIEMRNWSEASRLPAA